MEPRDVSKADLCCNLPKPVSSESITFAMSTEDTYRWQSIGQSRGLSNYTDVALFLISLYEKYFITTATSAVCKICRRPLPVKCSECSAKGSCYLQERGGFVEECPEDIAQAKPVDEEIDNPKQTSTLETKIEKTKHTAGLYSPVHDGTEISSPHLQSTCNSMKAEAMPDSAVHHAFSHKRKEGCMKISKLNKRFGKDKPNPRSDQGKLSLRGRISKEEKKIFLCFSCKASFRKQYTLKLHIQKSHSSASKFLCKLCAQDCLSAKGLYLHMQDNHTVFKCSECATTFTNDVKFKAHVRSEHPGIKPHHCEHCSKAYTSRQSLLLHCQKMHAGTHPQPDGLLRRDVNGGYLCQACSAAFHRQSLLKVHVASHRPHFAFLCNVCGQPCQDAEDLDLHMTDHKPFKCSICSAMFAHNTTYSAHMKSCHPGVKAHKCPHCDMAFNTRKWLAVHALKHTGERPHLCPECGKSFMEAQVLQRHRLALHQGSRAYACTKCNKRFKTSSALAYHRRCHAGVKSLLCENCGKTLLCPRALQNHKKNCKLHQVSIASEQCKIGTVNESIGNVGSSVGDENCNNRSDLKSHVCPDCGVTFKGEQWLYRHLVSKPATCTKRFVCKLCP